MFGLASLIPAAGCVVQLNPLAGPNPFITLAEVFGAGSIGATDTTTDGAAGAEAEAIFRQEMTVTLANNAADDELNVSLAAWVNPSSIRSREQEDALFNSGYVRLDEEVRIGSVFVLPPGTFVWERGGLAGAEVMRILPSGSATGGLVGEVSRTFITPDVILVFQDPPVSCDSVAFSFTQDGFPVDDINITIESFEPAIGFGGQKTLAQIDAYQCEPLRPGLFLKT
ncbi:MAG: hypothetical protein D6744_13755, partial [Planctomycetota bacterium]